MPLFGLFGGDEPSNIVVKNPNYNSREDKPEREYIRIRLNEDGQIAARDYVDRLSARYMLDDEEAIEASPRELEKLRSGEIMIRDIMNKTQNGEGQEARRPASEPKGDPGAYGRITGARRDSQIDRMEEEAVNPDRDKNRGNY